ncbi:MAG TPA: endonuclease/exonuclease/phosphatase family protein, partial [Myxococcota bacterium]|nr:endonuclease/exonuclease/phosphatase family protein [Myxococcota bacterium]
PWSYRHVAIRPDAYGVGVLSRLPLRDPRAEVVGEATELVARLDLPDGPVDLIVVHTTPPYRADWIDAWVDHLDWLAAAGERGRRIAVGDLNTSVFHPRFDILRDAGWRDAAEASGNRLQMTWPSAFPVLGLDHALVDGPFDVDQVRVLPGPGSDHRMLRVSLRL